MSWHGMGGGAGAVNCVVDSRFWDIDRFSNQFSNEPNQYTIEQLPESASTLQQLRD